MTRLEQLDFDNEDKLINAIKLVINKKEAFRTYTKDGEQKQVKIISNGRLYLGNNLSLGISKADNGKVYVSIDYFGVEDRIRIAQSNKTEFTDATNI